MNEPIPTLLKRRALSTVGLFALTALVVLLSPLLLVIALGWDVIRRRPLIATRVVVLLVFNLVIHVVGLCVFVSIPAVAWRPERRTRWQLAVEVWVARTALAAVSAVFGVRFVVDGGDACLERGPIILLPRHASLIDTLIPFSHVAGPHQLHLRYVMKSQLLWDPLVDAVGHAEASAFVTRGTDKHGPEIAKVVALADRLGPSDAIVIFPEGTRFTPQKRQRRLDWLAERHPDQHARAARLAHLLAPRLGGLDAILDACDADVVICAHTGLEGANHFADLMNGGLLGKTVHIEFWRIPADAIPRDAQARIDWFYDCWEQVDAWIEARASGSFEPQRGPER